MQISFGGLYAKKLQKFLCKTCAIVSLCHRFSGKAKNYQNLTTGSRSKQRFSLLQEKVVIQAVCLWTQAVSIKTGFGPMGRVFRKSQKISTASDQYFLSYIKLQE